jgi:hypothetical protein
MKDAHKKLELENERNIKAAEIEANSADDQARAGLQNQKAIHDREKHQTDLVKSDIDMQLARQKADLAIQQHQLKASDMVHRQQLAQQTAQQKIAQQGIIRQ